jgi:demethylmenaquinone methyltransferase / 2-methoxy-6-polyprenyl-1,4-benzoquinol methylase
MAEMFDHVVERYELLNRLISLGLDRRWRRLATEAVPTPRGQRILDLGCGTGEAGLGMTSRATVVGIDLSHEMLRRAREKGGGRIALVRGSAARLPFVDAAFGGAVSAFVLRNLGDLEGAFAELARVLAPGAALALFDISKPTRPVLRLLFGLYFAIVPPALGSLVGRGPAYRYLTRSVERMPPGATLCRMLRSAGFVECRARPLSGGMVTLVSATREAPGAGSVSR